MKTYLLVATAEDNTETYEFHGKNALSMAKDKVKLYESEGCFCKIYEVKPVYETRYEATDDCD